MISSVSINQLNPITFTGPPERERIGKIAKLYAEVFAEEPWYEYKKCSKNHYFGKGVEEDKFCKFCDSPLTLAYPKEETIAYITKELKEPNGTLITFEDKEGEVYAAGWGYSRQNLKSKYDTKEMQERSEQVLQGKGDSVFYLSEMMVDKRARGQKIATKSAKLLLGQAKQRGENMVMRTHNTSPMVSIANSLQMDQIIQVGEDTENGERVLFCSKIGGENEH